MFMFLVDELVYELFMSKPYISQRINFAMTVVLEKPSTFGQHTFPSLVPLHSILKIFTLVLAKGFERSTTAAGSTTSSDLRLSFIFFMGSVSCS